MQYNANRACRKIKLYGSETLIVQRQSAEEKRPRRAKISANFAGARAAQRDFAFSLGETSKISG